MVLYDFNEGQGDVAFDAVKRFEGLELGIADSNAVRWISGGLEIQKPTLLTTALSVADLSRAIERTGEVSIEAWLEVDAPDAPPGSKVLHGGAADPGGEGIDLTLKELVDEWRLMADLYATAVKMDRTRFGSLTFLAAGERIRLKGDYDYGQRRVFSFDDAGQRNASGSKGCSHEWWHEFRENKANDELRAHVHLKMRELAYFLSALDQADSMDANGKTILENSLITISTESGDGRHNDVQRELSGVFHAITGANGRFRTGEILDVNAEGVDVYNTMTAALGAVYKMGSSDRQVQRVDSLLS